MGRKNPATSMEAYKSLNPARIHQNHIDITKALEAIGKGNYESIAAYLGWEESKVWKRLKETVDAKLIHNTGEWVKTKRGYKSYLFAAGPASEELERKKRVMKGKSIPDFAKAIHQVKPSQRTTESLF